MNVSDIISIICSIIGIIIAGISLAVSIIIFKSQRKLENSLNERDEKRYNSQVEADANKFIQKYNVNDEIQLLALCVIAKKYDSTFPYRRQIYKDFCCLNDDVQIEVLKKMDIDLRLMDLDNKNFFDNCLELLKVDLKKYFPSYESFYSDHFYDGAKYFYRSIKNYKDEKVPEINVTFSNGIKATYVKFDDIVTDILARVDYKDYLKPLNELSDKDKINYLFNINTDLGSARGGQEIVMDYLECLIAKYVPIYLYKHKPEYEEELEKGNAIENIGYYCDYFAFKDDYYMEDLFLEALLTLNVYTIKDKDSLIKDGEVICEK